MKAVYFTLALTFLLLLSWSAEAQQRRSRPSSSPAPAERAARGEHELREDTMLLMTFYSLMFDAIDAAKFPLSKANETAARLHANLAAAPPLDPDMRRWMIVGRQFHEAQAKVCRKFEPQMEEMSEAGTRIDNALGTLMGNTVEDMERQRERKKERAAEELDSELKKVLELFKEPLGSASDILRQKYGPAIIDYDSKPLRAAALGKRESAPQEVLLRDYLKGADVGTTSYFSAESYRRWRSKIVGLIQPSSPAVSPGRLPEGVSAELLLEAVQNSLGMADGLSSAQKYRAADTTLKRVAQARVEIEREVTNLERLRAFFQAQVKAMSDLGVFSSGAMMLGTLLGGDDVGGAVTGFVETDLEQLLRDRMSLLDYISREDATLRAGIALMKGKAGAPSTPSTKSAPGKRRG